MKIKDIRISTIQNNLAWEDPATNRKNFSQLMAPLAGRTDLVLLPEMFTTGFSMTPQPLAESMDGPTVEWMQRQAEQMNAVICGTIIAEAGGKFFNRLIWMRPNGHFDFYDKRHLFSLAGEDRDYDQGKKRMEVEWEGWKICPLICYDLRFPVWSRNTTDFDLLIYLANWPEMRSLHWRALLLARAIENQCYTIGLNRIGKDGNDVPYIGQTTVFDYNGAMLFQAAHQENVNTVRLNWEEQQQFRRKLAFLKDRDAFTLT